MPVGRSTKTAGAAGEVLVPADELGESVSLGEGDADSALGEAAVGDITALGDVLVAVGGTVAQPLSNRATPRALSAREVMAMRQR
ncbi:protein of unknown function [Micropruina glycogenica]|uniref:Uncharacterized protein n=1 Tax=Micropruina glycogenica TaxID=75385 RepID=A0A2N9JJ63_9ACTN|nr:protein of unknown function [Micropruina glycogenica]